MRISLVLLASCSLLPFGALAMAQETTQGEDGNFYGAVRAGVNWAHDEALEGNFRSKDDRDTGFVLGGAFGYDFKPIRVELEYLYRRNDLDGLDVRADGGAGAALGLAALSGPVALDDSRVSASTIMLNAIYDVPVVRGIQPYLGVGLGLAVVDTEYRLAGGQSLLNSNTTEPAFQALAGLSSPLSEHWTAELGYRFLVTGLSDLQVADSIDARGKYKAHSVLFGLRYAFGGNGQAAPKRTAAPAPAPAPVAVNQPPQANDDRARVMAGESVEIDVLGNDRDADGRITGIATIGEAGHGTITRGESGRLRYQADPRFVGQDRFTYSIQDDAGDVATATVMVDVLAPEIGPFIVFFDFDSTKITADAQQILQDAADAFAKYGIARVELVGHADKAGPQAYNEKLSQRRADQVKDALARIGVPDGVMTTLAKGELDPLVPTNDGVREPQNRRVEILYPQPGE
ncbi:MULTISPECIES: OmpA family protein [unclassified Iodidimonas]|uniref:Ig-like domain-containing protein n=1 Tax=unclassified Iodidimonas TaxID=2626145 RepID=UPI00248289E6|nr:MULTISPECIES: OmpA family protein [unclassified Iodidimonas]